MPTDPKKVQPGAEQRPGGAESKDERHGQAGGHRTKSGGTYGDFVPDSGQPRRNDDRDHDPQMGHHGTGGGNAEHVGEEPRSPHPQGKDAKREGTARTGSYGETVPDPEEAAQESNRNKSFDTTHVHSGTTTRKV